MSTVPSNDIHLELNSHWEPFRVGQNHLTFNSPTPFRLRKKNCSHGGPAVYKWEGLIKTGSMRGKTGILIGECGNLHQRINQYRKGTQKNGNKKWRNEFLSIGDIGLFILRINLAKYNKAEIEIDLASGCWRQIIEQLLVKQLISSKLDEVWVVNRRQ